MNGIPFCPGCGIETGFDGVSCDDCGWRALTVTVDDRVWTGDEMRSFAAALRDQHTPGNQADNPYPRCAYCNYTRHPCDTYDLASMVLALTETGDPT